MSIIDVLIPAYNCAATVESAVASIQKQTIRDIRIIVVDDGSTDGTPQILEALAAADPRLLVLTKSNSGIVDALNLGFTHCAAEYMARHDADDIAYPERFARQLEYLSANADCVAVGCYARHIDVKGRPLGTLARPQPPDNADASATPAKEPYLMHPFLMARTADVRAVGGYRHCYLAEDADLYWRLQERGRLHNLPQILGDYRMHDSSLSGRSIVNGRLMALFSQLAAISAVRRRSGEADLRFTADIVDRFRMREDLRSLFELGSEQLSRPEQEWLKLAAALKLAHLSLDRPYELDRQDCAFIGEALREAGGSRARLDLERVRAISLALGLYLVKQGRVRDAITALPAALYPRLVARVALGLIIPGPLKPGLRRLLRRG